jgi:F420-non-reducing hydrogenase small subunit
MKEKLKLAIYWGAGCGGCEVSFLDINEKILDVAAVADIVFFPLGMDFKYSDVRDYPDGWIDVCLFNGSIRNSEAEEMAHLLRKKSKIMVAYGSCAQMGGIPGLGNLANKNKIFEIAYKKTASTNNPTDTFPLPRCEVNEGELDLPEFYDTVKALDQVIDVEYYLPGCPPTVKWINTAIDAIVSGNLPPKGSVIGLKKTVCDECPREKKEKVITEFKRFYEVIPDPDKCLLEQGIICNGPATRGGCEAACLSVNMPCRGCFGPTDEVIDQGMKLTSAIASIVKAENEKEATEKISKIVDPVGTFYMYCLPKSLLRRARMDNQIKVDEVKEVLEKETV